MSNEILRFVAIFGTGLGLLMAVALRHLAVTLGEYVPGLKWWSGGMIATAAGGVLFALRDASPTFASIVVANILFFLGTVAFVQGTRLFLGLSKLTWPWVLAGAYGVIIVLFTYLFPDFRVRTIASALCVLAMNAILFRDLWQHGVKSLGARVLMAGVIFRVGLSAFRIIVGPESAPTTHLFSTTYIQIVSLLSATLWILIFSIGFILLTEKRVRERLIYASCHDDLTGIFNRHSFSEKAEQFIVEAQDESSQAAMIIFDLDNFKLINDQYGHIVGDRVIKNFASHIREEIEPHGVVGRFGGEEFVALLPGRDVNDVSALLAEIGNMPASNEVPPVTFSAGVAVRPVSFTGRDSGAFVVELIKAADAALYRAKAAGRNQIAIG